MARGLGCIEFADGTLRYFVHCETAGSIFPPLFESGRAARTAYERIGVDGLCALSANSRDIEIVKLAAESGWPHPDWAWKFDGYGLATREAVLQRAPVYRLPDALRLQLQGGVVHVDREVDGGFDGCYDSRLCSDSGNYEPDARPFGFQDGFGTGVTFCPDCAALLVR